MNIELYKMISLNEPFPYTSMLRRVVYYEIYIPTEVIINKPRMCYPVQSVRVFDSGLFLTKDGEMLDYQELYKKEFNKTGTFSGTYHYNPIYLVEIWSNYGSDGHIEYKFFGWRFVPKSLLEYDIRAWKESQCDNNVLPDCMTYDSDKGYMERASEKFKIIGNGKE